MLDNIEKLDFGWVLIYVFAFGISDIFVKNYIRSDIILIFYYILIGIIGIYILSKKSNIENK